MSLKEIGDQKDRITAGEWTEARGNIYDRKHAASRVDYGLMLIADRPSETSTVVWSGPTRV